MTNNNVKKELADGLSKLLAESYMTLLKSHKFHWNVKGKMFFSLHNLFEEQYTELFSAVDNIAEHILTLGYPAPGTFKEFMEVSKIKESTDNPEALEMVKILKNDHGKIVETARSILGIAEEHSFPETADLVTQRIQTHEKTRWMLESILE